MDAPAKRVACCADKDTPESGAIGSGLSLGLGPWPALGPCSYNRNSGNQVTRTSCRGTIFRYFVVVLLLLSSDGGVKPEAMLTQDLILSSDELVTANAKGRSAL